MNSQNDESGNPKLTVLGPLLFAILLLVLATSCVRPTPCTPPDEIEVFYDEETISYNDISETPREFRLPDLDNKDLYYSCLIECSTNEGEDIPTLFDDEADIRLDWQGKDGSSENISPLRIFFVPDDPRKASFIQIRNSKGQVSCHAGATPSNTARPEDFAPHPMADLEDAPPGEYFIWVGVSEDEADTVHGTLFVTTDLDVDPYEVQINPWGDAETELALETDFAPDPEVIDVSGKASIDLTHLYEGEMWKDGLYCDGFALSVDPTARVTWPGDTDLRMYFVADEDSSPGILIVHATEDDPNPTSDWYCSDSDPFVEGYSTDPLLTAFESGWFGGVTYNVWVAGHNQGDEVSGKLYFSQLEFDTENPSGVNVKGSSIFGEETFSGETINETFYDLVSLVASVDLEEDECSSYFTTREPAYILNWSGQDYLTIHALFDPAVRDDLKPALLIVDPMGIAKCNSPDTGNPVVTYPSSEAQVSERKGKYRVWVGSQEGGKILDGSLCITDIEDDSANPCR